MEHREETVSLISGDKVAGTNVYNADGENLGEIHDVMIDKRTGKVVYAVMSFGGFLGIGENYHPLPWATLTYDTGKEGYVVNLSKEQLKSGPTYAADADPVWSRDYERSVYDYYKVPPYWGI